MIWWVLTLNSHKSSWTVWTKWHSGFISAVMGDLPVSRPCFVTAESRTIRLSSRPTSKANDLAAQPGLGPPEIGASHRDLLPWLSSAATGRRIRVASWRKELRYGAPRATSGSGAHCTTAASEAQGQVSAIKNLLSKHKPCLTFWSNFWTADQECMYGPATLTLTRTLLQLFYCPLHKGLSFHLPYTLLTLHWP